jgi:glutathione S-transferase
LYQVLNYKKRFDHIVKLQIFSETPKVEIWRNALQQRPSVKNAVSSEYPELLLQFLVNRKSYISSLMSREE